MFFYSLRIFALLTVFITLAFPSYIRAEATENMSELMNRSGMQRMLSQRIAKAYFYLGNDVSVKETKLQMEIYITKGWVQ